MTASSLVALLRPQIATSAPEAAKEKPQVGEITAVGPGKVDDNGTRRSMDVNVGDKVLYSKYAGTEIKLGDDEYILLSEKDILATVS